MAVIEELDSILPPQEERKMKARPEKRAPVSVSDLGEHPLFMRSLPTDADPESADSATLSALQALVYDGEPTEVADGLKEQGNELFKQRKYRDAMGFYTRALDECGKDLPISHKRTLWSNRSACNLELGNYGATLRDTAAIISSPLESAEPVTATWNKTTLKALFRSARALNALDKLDEALDVLKRMRVLEGEIGDDQDVGKALRGEVEKKVEKRERREKEKAERERRAREGEEALRAAIKASGAVIPKSAGKKLFEKCPTDITPPHFDPDCLPPTANPDLPLIPADPSDPAAHWSAPPADTPLIFPVFLLLPLASPPTRDLCLEFHTHASFGQVLESMEHDPSQYQVYIATTQGKVLKVGSKLLLGKVLASVGKAPKEGSGEKQDGWELTEGWALEMVAVPKGSEGEKWVEGWKEEVKKGVGALL